MLACLLAWKWKKEFLGYKEWGIQSNFVGQLLFEVYFFLSVIDSITFIAGKLVVLNELPYFMHK